MIPVPQEELERLRKAFQAGGHGSGAGRECPSVEAIWAAATGEAESEAVEDVIDHTVTCGACGEAWRVARAIAAERAADGERVGGSAAAERRRGMPWTAVAAAALVVIAAGVAYQQNWLGRDEAAVFRSGSDPMAVESLVGAAPLPRDRFVLRWTPGPDGSRYNVTVTAEDLTPITSGSALDSTEFTVPEDALGAVRPGATIVWQVETVTPDGRRAQSAAFLTRIQ